jgi:polyisoprenoid-binding protein YceI
MSATQTKTTTTWKVDPVHSNVEFAVRYAMLSTVRGHFSNFEGTITLDPENPANSKAVGTIDAASIDTGNEQRDGHLRTGDFFEVEQYPNITFESTRIEPSGDRWKVYGNLTIRGVTREVVLNTEYLGQMKDAWGNERAGFEASTEINRKAFGLNWNAPLEQAGGMLVSDNVKLNLNISAIQVTE